MKILYDIVKGMFIIPALVVFWPTIIFIIVYPTKVYWVVANFLWGCGLVYAYLNSDLI